MDGKIPGLSACGAKTPPSTSAVQVESSELKSRAFSVCAAAAGALAGELKSHVFAAMWRRLERTSKGPSFSSESQRSLPAHTPARGVRGSGKGCRARSGAEVVPNPSVKRTRNGVAPGPCGRVVYPRPNGPGATPLRAAYLER